VAGPFPLFTDACVNGHLIEALIRMVFWPQEDYRRWTIGQLLQAFEDLAAEEDPFQYPLRRLKPSAG
jgi:hypothetical protein